MCVYFCVVGGIDVFEMMGLCSIDLKVGFGGFEGCLLKDGDRLFVLFVDMMYVFDISGDIVVVKVVCWIFDCV